MNWTRVQVSAAAIAIAALGALVLPGCPGEGLDDTAAIQRAVAAYRAADLALKAPANELAGVTSGALGGKINFNRTLDETLDLDTEFEGADIAPNATGMLRVSGTVAFDAELGTGGTLSADALRCEFLTDVVVTDPLSNASAAAAKDGFLEWNASGSFGLTAKAGFMAGFDMSTQVSGLQVIVADGGAPAKTKLDLTSSTAVNYVDQEIADLDFGTLNYAVDTECTVTWSQRFQRYTVVLDVILNDTTEAITVTVNGTRYGPYTLQEFSDSYDALPWVTLY